MLALVLIKENKIPIALYPNKRDPLRWMPYQHDKPSNNETLRHSHLGYKSNARQELQDLTTFKKEKFVISSRPNITSHASSGSTSHSTLST